MSWNGGRLREYRVRFGLAMVGDMARHAPRSAQPGVRALATRVGADP